MEEKVARIHSFESFGTVDGPGIRFVVFMQGCALKCKYCHNRDTWRVNSGTKYTVSQVLDKILRVRPYFETSSGGVTISGGEPLLQSEFVLELFKKLKEYGIHTTIDTAGSVQINKTIKELLKYTDLVLLDIKHIDDKKCINLTGFSNNNTLEFAKYLSKNKIPIWIRQVIVPTITDDEEDLKKLKKFISSLSSVENIELLAYHDLGKYKWENLGLKYPLENIRVANLEDIEKAKEILNI